MLEKLRMNRRGSISYYITFMSLAIFALLLATVLVPFAMDVNVTSWAAAENILEHTAETAASIRDSDIRAALTDSITAAEESVVTSTDVMSVFFQYSAFIIIVVVLFVIFIKTRRDVETDVIS